jgi:hypothetical protein
VLALPVPLAGPLLAPAATAVAAAAAAVAAAAAIQAAYNEFRQPLPPLLPGIGRAGSATLQDLLKDFEAGVRIPAGFIPPGGPQLPPIIPDLISPLFEQLGKGLSQIWGLANRPRNIATPRINITDSEGAVSISGTMGGLAFTTQYRIAYGPRQFRNGENCEFTYDLDYLPFGNWFTLPGVPGGVRLDAQKLSTNPCGKHDNVRLYIDLLNGETVLAGALSGGPFTFYSFQLDFRAINANPLPINDLEAANDGRLLFRDFPDYSPSPLPRLPLPGADPVTAPDGEPVTQPEIEPLEQSPRLPVLPIPSPVPSAPPWVVPFSPGAPSPSPQIAPSPYPGSFPGPGTAPVLPPGVLAPLQPVPVPTTPPGNVYPIPGAPPLVDNGPRADVVGIARELGNLEQKLHGLMNRPGGQSPSPDWLNDLLNALPLLQLIADILTTDADGVTYRLRAPCDRDSNGDFLEWEQQIPPADFGPSILYRLDALMDAIDKVNTWKRTICKQPTPVGNVTITALEVQEE